LAAEDCVGVVEQNIAAAFEEHNLELDGVERLVGAAVGYVAPLDDKFSIRSVPRYLPENIVVSSGAVRKEKRPEGRYQRGCLACRNDVVVFGCEPVE